MKEQARNYCEIQRKRTSFGAGFGKVSRIIWNAGLEIKKRSVIRQITFAVRENRVNL